MAQFLQALQEERQANNAAIRQLAQTLVNHPPQDGNGNGRSTLSEFMRTTPPIFTETTEPLDADDWIRTIEDLLALVKCTDDNEKVLYATHCLGGTARAWWDGFQIMWAGQVITWAVFKDGFCAAHIPPGMMTIKKREFRALRQGVDQSRSICRSSTFYQGMHLKMSALRLPKWSALWKDCNNHSSINWLFVNVGPSVTWLIRLLCWKTSVVQWTTPVSAS